VEIDLSALDAVMAVEPAADAGGPLSLPIDLIDEDPSQPRTEFDAETLRELATTIAERGVRQPVSVRSHTEHPDRWILNFGARRLRASKLAGRTEIPAFVDETANTYDQVIENEQREGLQPMELALFIARRLQAGDSQADIARRLGKSRMYITYLCTLIDAPDWLMTLYRQGKCRGMTELYELARLQDELGTEVMAWAAKQPTISRSDIRALKRQLADRSPRVQADVAAARSSALSRRMGKQVRDERAAQGAASAGPSVKGEVDPDKHRVNERIDLFGAGRTRLFAMKADQVVEVMLDVVPEEIGMVFVRAIGCGDRRLIRASELILLRLEPAV
jgi:ParB family transcriptional regulator, chromosome partitioning protein